MRDTTDDHDCAMRGAVAAAGAECPPAMPAVVDPGVAIEKRPSHPFYALRFRNFRLFFVGQLISVAGSWMQTVAQQWLVYSLTHSAQWLGIVTGASAIPYVALGLYGGNVADRVPRRAVLVATQTTFMLLAVVLTVLATNWLVPIQAWHIAVLAGMTGLVNAFNMPAQQAFVTDMVDERAALPNAIALNSLMFNLARFVGPIFAGAVLVKLGAAACFGLNAVSFLAVIASLVLMKLPPQRRRAALSVRDAFRFIGADRSVLRTILLIAAGSLLAWSFSTLFPVYAVRFHTGAAGFTGLMAAQGVGAATGGVTMAWLVDRLPRRTLLYGAAVLTGMSLLLFTSARSYAVAIAWLVVCGFAMISFGINANTKVQEEVPDRLRGRVMAIYSLVFMGLMPLGGLELGSVAEYSSANVAIRVNSALCLAVALGLLAWSEAERRRMARAVA